MSQFFTAVIFVLLSLRLVAQAGAEEQQPEAGYSAAAARLGSDDFEEREAATDLLWRAGKAAIPALEAAANSKDAETATRAKALLDKFRLGIRPDTPAELVALIEEFGGAEEPRQHQILGELSKQQQYETMHVLFRRWPAEMQKQYARDFQIPSTQIVVGLWMRRKRKRSSSTCIGTLCMATSTAAGRATMPPICC